MANYVGDYCAACGTKTVERILENKPRPVCPNCGRVSYFDPKSAAIAYVCDEQGRILLIQRGIGDTKGLWALPGGYIDVNEHPKDAAIRETFEETGLQVEVARLIDVYFDVDDGGVITIAYAVRILGGELQAGDDALDAVWFSREDVLPELIFVSTKAIVARWLAGDL